MFFGVWASSSSIVCAAQVVPSDMAMSSMVLMNKHQDDQVTSVADGASPQFGLALHGVWQHASLRTCP